MRPCIIEGCDKPAVARGWCTKHHKRWQIHGDPLYIKRGREPVRVQVGERYGRLVVMDDKGRNSDMQRLLICRCDCGNTTVVAAGKLRYGSTRSCGCLRREPKRRTHGMSKHPLYQTWRGIRTRCHNPNSATYRYYGGRGVYLDSRWEDFPTFVRDMGEKPGPDHSLDRIDPDGPYSPENCRWATKEEQRRNQRPKALGATTNVIFDEELTAAIDKMRGEQTRGDWVRELVRDVTLSFPPR